MIYGHFGMKLLLVLLRQTSCEIETLCNEKLARTRGKVGGCSSADVGLSV